MDKSDFLKTYRPLFTINGVHFYYDVFETYDNFTVVEGNLLFEKFMDFHVLRTVKNGRPDLRGIEDRENDPASRLITLKEARRNPEKWDLDQQHRAMPTHKNIRPIPIATDLSSKRTLILDSNHLLANISYSPDLVLPIVRIVGPVLDKVVRDFIILNRQ